MKSNISSLISHNIIEMGRITKAPVYIDDGSMLDDRQIRKLNSIIKSQMNMFTSKAVQEQEGTPEPETPVTSRSSRVLSVVSYKYNGGVFISCQVDVGNIGVNTFDLFQLDTGIRSLTYDGYFDTDLSIPVTQYVTMSVNDGLVSVTFSADPPGEIMSLNLWGHL